MQYRVLQTLPHGQLPGSLVDLNPDEARVLLLVNAVEPVAAATPAVKKPTGRRYNRRDLEASQRAVAEPVGDGN